MYSRYLHLDKKCTRSKSGPQLLVFPLDGFHVVKWDVCALALDSCAFYTGK